MSSLDGHDRYSGSTRRVTVDQDTAHVVLTVAAYDGDGEVMLTPGPGLVARIGTSSPAVTGRGFTCRCRVRIRSVASLPRRLVLRRCRRTASISRQQEARPLGGDDGRASLSGGLATPLQRVVRSTPTSAGLSIRR